MKTAHHGEASFTYLKIYAISLFILWVLCNYQAFSKAQARYMASTVDTLRVWAKPRRCETSCNIALYVDVVRKVSYSSL